MVSMTACWPRMAARTSEGLVALPAKTRTLGRVSLMGSRTRAVTVWPLARARSTTRLPVLPVAPKTRRFMGLLWRGLVRGKKLGLVLGGEGLDAGDEVGLRGGVEWRRRGGAGRDRGADFGEELFLTGGRTDAEQADGLGGGVAKLVRS